jgi:hypothetical protein
MVSSDQFFYSVVVPFLSQNAYKSTFRYNLVTIFYVTIHFAHHLDNLIVFTLFICNMNFTLQIYFEICLFSKDHKLH